MDKAKQSRVASKPLRSTRNSTDSQAMDERIRDRAGMEIRRCRGYGSIRLMQEPAILTVGRYAKRAALDYVQALGKAGRFC